MYQVDHHLLCNAHSLDTKLWLGRIDNVTAGQFSDSRNHVSELCMDSIQAYVCKQHSMLPIGIKSRDIPFSRRDGNVRSPTSFLLISHHGLGHLHLNNLT